MCVCVCFVCDYIGSCLKLVGITKKGRKNSILSMLHLVKKKYMKLKKHCVGCKWVFLCTIINNACPLANEGTH